VDGKLYDFRVSTTPTIFGESIVIRILDSNKALLPLEKLGISSYNLKRLKRAIQAPYGLILVTGPTGSGKTTTLYSILNQLKGVEKKIITVEDPVEYRIPEIQQIQVNPQVGRTFQVVLRSLLRQDPDIIMVGEIRDKETLNIAIEAGLTGHLVLATLHTNSAIGAVGRILEMGGEPALLAETLVAVIAQRLVRKLCPYCKHHQLPSLERLELVKPFLKGKKIKFYGPQGCPHCNFTGYSGRESVTEILLNSRNISHLIQQRADSLQIEEVAEYEGFRKMIEDGLEKVEQGVTSLAELLRVVKVD
jgi:general secretion pathway protein E/type IV pilus assembly protein PilB